MDFMDQAILTSLVLEPVRTSLNADSAAIFQHVP